MSEIKTFIGNFKMENMQITYKIRKVKEIYDKVLKKLLANYRKF